MSKPRWPELGSLMAKPYVHDPEKVHEGDGIALFGGEEMKEITEDELESGEALKEQLRVVAKSCDPDVAVSCLLLIAIETFAKSTSPDKSPFRFIEIAAEAARDIMLRQGSEKSK